MNGTSSQPGAEGTPDTGCEDPADARAAGPEGVRVRRDGAARGLWSRDFGLFFVARAVARVLPTMLPVALAAGLLQHGYGAGAVGLAMAATAAAFAGLVVFGGGVIADRFSTRRLMIGAVLVRLGTQALTAALFFSGHVVLWEICAIGFANGVAGAVFQPGVASTVPRLATDVQGANGAIRVAESAAQLAGTRGRRGPGRPGLARRRLRRPRGHVRDQRPLPAAAPAAPARTGEPPRPGRRCAGVPGRSGRGLAGVPLPLLALGVILVWCVYMIAVWGPTVPLVATEVVQQHGPGAYGLINSALGAGTVVGGLLALRLRPRRMLRAGAVALVGFAVFPASVGAGLGVSAMAAGAAVAGAGLSFWGVMWATTVQTQVPPEVLNLIDAYDVAGSLAMMPVGQALAGPAASLLGTEQVLLAAGVTSLVVVLALLASPPIRDLPLGRPAHRADTPLTSDCPPSPQSAPPLPNEPVRAAPRRNPTSYRTAQARTPASSTSTRSRSDRASSPCAAMCSANCPYRRSSRRPTPRPRTRCGTSDRASLARAVEVPARYGSTRTTSGRATRTARRSASASKGRTVVAYSTVVSRPSVAASTASSIGPTATTTPEPPSRTVRNRAPSTGSPSPFDCTDSRTYTLSSPAATACRSRAAASSGWPGTCTVQPSRVSACRASASR
ncbi:hypothetical protein SFUMM280S_05792 [Streptomyces fumanus]